MSRTLPLAAVQPKLSELVAGMVAGEKLVLTANGEPVAILIRPPRRSWPCQPGTAKDRSFWMAPELCAEAQATFALAERTFSTGQFDQI